MINRTYALTYALLMGLLSAPAPASATPIVGPSWDGLPPGTVADITGITEWSLGSESFQPGLYDITWDGGITAWVAQDRVFAGTTELHRNTPVTLSFDHAWLMSASTPDYALRTSLSTQFAFASTGAGTLVWGLEDIRRGLGDDDYQDAYGTLTRLGEPRSPTAVPEPLTLVGIGSALLIGRRALKRNRG